MRSSRLPCGPGGKNQKNSCEYRFRFVALGPITIAQDPPCASHSQRPRSASAPTNYPPHQNRPRELSFHSPRTLVCTLITWTSATNTTRTGGFRIREGDIFRLRAGRNRSIRSAGSESLRRLKLASMDLALLDLLCLCRAYPSGHQEERCGEKTRENHRCTALWCLARGISVCKDAKAIIYMDAT